MIDTLVNFLGAVAILTLASVMLALSVLMWMLVIKLVKLGRSLGDGPTQPNS